ncbi:hypothetical protein CVT24_004496 [Panaeolus cyanescens]|uniref:Thioesterase domain-containing protein n=1 Tax=Panaeolus cyanescens TaxID=181874 RepID=A0A409YBR0_9AGAR|nr:hypothetical protein CVT24_004496 [Panaeolus cyanescens]
MAPFNKAVKVVPVIDEASAGPTKTYEGVADKTWIIGSVMNGGYALALILQACIQFQSKTNHVDPIHITAHFLRATLASPFKVRVRLLKRGESLTNLTAELLQNDTVKIMAHAIFGLNEPLPQDKLRLTLEPPSTYARRHPLYDHPSKATIKPMRSTWAFHTEVQWTREAEIEAKNRPDHPNRTNSKTVGGGGLEWGAWLMLTDKEERITNPSLMFFVDMFQNTPSLLPKSEKPGLGVSWFPTVTLAVEFKHKIPPPSSIHADRTVGIYSSGRFLNNPQGRHDVYVEVWTAPSNIGEGEPTENWRDNQYCLATATQMALTLPMEVNQRKGKPKANL